MPGSDKRTRDDRALLLRYQESRDPALRDELFQRFLPLARQLARRYERSDEPLDDLVQVAAIGLVKAIDRFDPDRPVAFSSYAVPTILGELRRHFRDRTWSVRVPRDLQELVLRVERATAELYRASGRSPTVSELADALGETQEHVLEALGAGAAYRTMSLDTPRAGDTEGDTLGETVGGADGGFGRAEERATLEQLMRSITPREREVLRLRFESDLTQAEIGERIGVSQMQVSRLIRQALVRLRTAAGEQPR